MPLLGWQHSLPNRHGEDAKRRKVAAACPFRQLKEDRKKLVAASRARTSRDGVLAVYLELVEFVRWNFRNGVPPSATSMTNEILAEQISEHADSESKANEHARPRVN